MHKRTLAGVKNARLLTCTYTISIFGPNDLFLTYAQSLLSYHGQLLLMDEFEDIEDGEVRKDFYKGGSEKPPNCEICNKTFPWAKNTLEDFKTYIEPHILAQHIWICSECDKSFHTEEDLKQHMVGHLKKKFSVVCPHCGESFETKSELGKHLSTYHICNFCDFVSSDGAEILRKHKLIVHFNWHECLKCSYIFTSSKELNRHFSLAHTLAEHRWICNECYKSSHTEEDLKKHMVEHLKENCSAVCPHCEVSFETKSELGKHLSTYHICNFCDFVSSNFVTLRKHKRIVHFNWHACSKCSYIFISSKELNRHFSIAHKCEYCGRIKPNKVFLTNHIRRNHLGWFSCSHCKHMFETKEQITNHTNTAHQCSHCGLLTTSVDILSEHITTHIFKYTCHKCDFKAISKHQMFKHMRRFHKDTDITFPFIQNVSKWKESNNEIHLSRRLCEQYLKASADNQPMKITRAIYKNTEIQLNKRLCRQYLKIYNENSLNTKSCEPNLKVDSIIQPIETENNALSYNCHICNFQTNSNSSKAIVNHIQCHQGTSIENLKIGQNIKQISDSYIKIKQYK